MEHPGQRCGKFVPVYQKPQSPRFRYGWMGPTPQQMTSSGLYKNQLSAEGLESGTNDVPNAVTLWRMPF